MCDIITELNMKNYDEVGFILKVLLQRRPPLAVSGRKQGYRLSLRSSIREDLALRSGVRLVPVKRYECL
jgi:hypothetical protein